MSGVAHGVGVQTHGVWMAALMQVYAWPRSVLSLGPMFFHLCAGLIGIVIGRVIDRYGPCATLYIGTLALAGGSLVLGTTHHLWQLYGGFVLLGVGFAALGHVMLGKIIAPWFQG